MDVEEEAAVVADVHAIVGMEAAAGLSGYTPGLGVTLGWPGGSPLQLELSADVRMDSALRVDAMPGLRGWLYQSGRGRLGLVAAYGISWQDTLVPAGTTGLAIELPLGRIWLRTQAGVDLQVDEPVGARLSIGVRARRVATPPAPVVNQSPTLQVEPANARIWVPHPYCMWVPVEQAATLLADVPLGTTIRVDAPGFIPATVELGQVNQLTLTPAPPQGGLIVVGAPGDEIRVGGFPVAVAADGVAVIAAAEGPHLVTVIGGGRRQTLEVAVADQHATWVRAIAAPPVRISFDASSAALSPAAHATLTEIAAAAGGWHFLVRGSFSTEGSPEVNLALATARADAVAQALIAAGVPADHVKIGESLPPDASLSLEDQRMVLINPQSGAP